MLSFKSFLYEARWTTPHHSDEHDEVHHQTSDEGRPHAPDHVHKMLDHLKHPDNYHQAMKNGKTMHITPMSAKKVSNTDAGSKPKPGTIDSEKSNRVKKMFASKKPIQKPIVLHDTHTGHTHLLAGNTRLTHNTHYGSKTTPVHAITYDSSKMSDNK
jgi:hypothetical protein